MSLTALELSRCPHFGNIASPGAVLRRSLDEERHLCLLAVQQRYASGERGTAEMKASGRELDQRPNGFWHSKCVRKNPANAPLRKGNEFNARSPLNCRML